MTRSVCVLAAVHDQHAIQACSPVAGLDQQRNVVHDELAAGRHGRFMLLPGLLGDQGVENGFQALPRGRIGEDQLAHAGAVEGALCVDQIGTKSLSDKGQGDAAACRQAARDMVGIDQRCAACLQPGCNRAFAAADAARQPQSEW
jgi:hypothetical protein